MKLAVTGHRPNKISNELYDVNSRLSKHYINFFKQYIRDSGATECISGMALGIDTLFAIATLQLRNEGLNIKLHCAIPCANHSSMWQTSSVKIYNAILERADEIVYVSNANYTPSCMQRRNEYMVNRCDKLLAVWDGTPSGTANCFRFASIVGCVVDRVAPNQI